VHFLYILAEILVTWLVLTTLGGLLIWGWSGFDSLGQLFMIGCTVIAFGASIKLVVIGDHRSVWTGFYRPIRILSLILPAIGAFRRESTMAGFGLRKTFTFDFRAAHSVSCLRRCRCAIGQAARPRHPTQQGRRPPRRGQRHDVVARA
jgi:hypothetical protein